MKKISLLLTFLLLCGCSNEINMKTLEDKSDEFILTTAKNSINNKKYKQAIEILQEFEKLYPYSKLTPEAQLLTCDCYERDKANDAAIAAYTIFVTINPSHEKVSYAMFKIGSIYFNQIRKNIRDQQDTTKALTYLLELQNRYPNSIYAKEAEDMIQQCHKQMAGREVHIARYYQKKENYAAAVSRLNTVVDNYLDSNHAPEALHRLVECYISMGFVKEAVLVNKLLQTQHPNSQWAKYSNNLLQNKISLIQKKK